MARRLSVFWLAIALLAASPGAAAGDITGLRLVEDAQGTRAQIEGDALAGYKLFSLANPDRLVIDLPGAGSSRFTANTPSRRSLGIIPERPFVTGHTGTLRPPAASPRETGCGTTVACRFDTCRRHAVKGRV